jgi:HEPN domain-containing protein
MDKELKENINNWIIKAEYDLKTVSNEFSSIEPVTDTICFHSQQAAEKYLKAYLISKGIPPEKTHKIERLIESCLKYDKHFIELKDTVILTQYAVDMRYPDDFYTPTIEEAKEALKFASKVKAFVLQRLNL